MSKPIESSRSRSSGAHRVNSRRDSGAHRRARNTASGFAYLLAAGAAAAALFFVLWWMLQDDETPWIPAGLAASVVLLVAASARLINSRRTRASLALDQSGRFYATQSGGSSSQMMRSTALHAAALRGLQKHAASADQKDNPDLHHEIYEMCCEYLAGAEKTLQWAGLQPDNRTALRGGQERVRNLQKHHMLAWARGSARALTREAQQRARLHEKIEAANRALDCITVAANAYPDEDELTGSARAVNDFITSTRVAHWIEMAERAAFKGYYQRAIDCYKDALFYLSRDRMSDDVQAAADRITREVDLLRARLNTNSN